MIKDEKTRLSEIHARYEKILQSPIPQIEKDKMLSRLMTLMEGAFRIPMIRNPEFEAKNKKVMSLYFMISNSRKTV